MAEQRSRGWVRGWNLGSLQYGWTSRDSHYVNGRGMSLCGLWALNEMEEGKSPFVGPLRSLGTACTVCASRRAETRP